MIPEWSEEKRGGKIWPVLFLALLLLAAAALNWHWHRTHVVPISRGHNPLVDGVHQLKAFDQDPAGQIGALFRQAAPHYSFYNLSAALTLFLFGRSYLGLVFISTFYYLLLIASVYLTVLRIGNLAGAVAGALSAALLPAAFGWSRVFSPHIAIMAVTAFGVWLLVVSDWFRRPLPLIMLALLAAMSFRLGGTVSDGIQVLVALAVVGAYALGVSLFLRQRAIRKRVLIFFCLAAVAFLAVFNFEYARWAIGYLWREGVSYGGGQYSPGNVWQHPEALLSYPTLMVSYLLRPFFSVLGLLSLVALMRRPRAEELLVLVYFWMPFVLVSLISKKNYAYVLALLPAVPMAIGCLVGRIKRPRLAVLMLLLILAAGGWTYLRWSFSAEDLPRYRDSFQKRPAFAVPFQEVLTLWLVSYPPPAREYSLQGLAEEIAAYGARNPGTTLLVLERAILDREADIFHLLLGLADWEGRVAVYDPLYELETQISGRRPRRDIPGRLEPDFVVAFLGNREITGYQYYLDEEHLLGFARGWSSVEKERYPVPVLEEGLRYWLERLEAVAWNEYRVRRIDLQPWDKSALTVEVLDRPEKGANLEW